MKLNRLRKRIRKETVLFMKKEITDNLDVTKVKTFKEGEILYHFHLRTYIKGKTVSEFTYYFLY